MFFFDVDFAITAADIIKRMKTTGRGEGFAAPGVVPRKKGSSLRVIPASGATSTFVVSSVFAVFLGKKTGRI